MSAKRSITLPLSEPVEPIGNPSETVGRMVILILKTAAQENGSCTAVFFGFIEFVPCGYSQKSLAPVSGLRASLSSIIAV
jgi:hypothetical protein